ncbi:E3 ubiquitin-protein ligase TRIM17-like [Salminus brasiliensis]|uniref:E3 ubiquitin-protein ligase TRIM17-like n=1 Tax=Salminus brasiliensis TaxID=930266 RepID=UPI003B837A07
MTPCPTWRQSDSPVMYCASCQVTLSTKSLVIDNHRKHRYVTLQEAVKEQLENIKERSRNLEAKVIKADDIEHQVSAAKCKLEDVYMKTRESILGHYDKLWKLLENNQKHARFLLEAERETLQRSLNQLEEDANNYQHKTDAMTKNIQKLRKRLKTENPDSLLAELSALEVSLEMTEEFYSSAKEKTFDGVRLRALEESVKNIIQKNKELLPRPWEFSEAVTFDSSRTHNKLEVSGDGSQILLKGFSTPLSNRHTAVQWYSAVAGQSFSKGQHYWEVEVEGSRSWAVGIVERGWENNMLDHPLGRDRASWALESDEGDLAALHRDESSLVGSCGVHRLGVCVDCDKGQVKMYDVSTGKVLHSFSVRVKRPLCPAFSLKVTTSSIAQLKICKITQDNQQYLQQDVQNSVRYSRGEEADSGAYTQSGDRLSEQSQ